MPGRSDRPSFRAQLGGCAIAVLAACQPACQPGMSTTPPVVAVPTVALGLPIYLSPDPVIGKVEDEVGRPLAIALVHGVRDAFEEAGFKLAPSPEAAGGLVARVSIQRVGGIHADLFIHGAEACSVRLDVTRGGNLVATAEPEVQCASTSSYYGILAKDAAVALVNTVSHAKPLLAIAPTLRASPAAPPSPPSPLPTLPPLPPTSAPLPPPPADAPLSPLPPLPPATVPR